MSKDMVILRHCFVIRISPCLLIKYKKCSELADSALQMQDIQPNKHLPHESRRQKKIRYLEVAILDAQISLNIRFDTI